MIHYSKYKLAESKDTLVFSFGRMNPPTLGHGKLLDKMNKISKDFRMYISKSQDKKKNPLDYKTKMDYVKKMFPQYSSNIVDDGNIRMVFDILVKAHDEGFKNITMVVGSDRVKEFELLIKKYNGEQARHGFYDFANIMVVSAGERDPDADDVSGMSASKMRQAVQDNDLESFQQGVPRNWKHTLDLFKAVEDGMK